MSIKMKWAAFAAAVALLSLSGCKSSAPPTRSATASPSASGKTPTIPAHPCGLLNQSEAVSVIGTAVKAVPIDQPNYVGCNYGPSVADLLTSKGELIVVMFPRVSASSWMQAVAPYTHQAGGQPVSNLGDAAVAGRFSASGGNTTYVAVLDGPLAVVVERVTYAGAAASVSTVVNLARTVLGRL